MKIYAIKDRLIEYFMQPFVAQSDKQVLASLATAINSKETNSGIQAAPHHFEIWALGEVNEDTGRITPQLELLADCGSLVRTNLREGGDTASGERTNGTAPSKREGAPSFAGSSGGA